MKTNVSVNCIHDHYKHTSKQEKRRIKQVRRNRNVARQVKRGVL